MILALFSIIYWETHYERYPQATVAAKARTHSATGQNRVGNMKKIALAFDVVVGTIFNLIDLLIFEFLLHRTARVIVPLVSFGKIEVEDIHAVPTGFNWLGLKRRDDGRYVLNSTMSMLAAAIFWLLCLVVYFAFTRDF
ncbi:MULTISPECIES: hypothetical protein [unclassified Ensifer]|uniref:hypothetical protein n=1 Tax=unclassified Ensifer TaxID=2633371 RepID=UPI001146A7DA|nr:MULTISPECIES: hypothetical protein [unclassified Ensifer]